jgi:uncharacterized protein (DUF1330 family)
MTHREHLVCDQQSRTSEAKRIFQTGAAAGRFADKQIGAAFSLLCAAWRGLIEGRAIMNRVVTLGMAMLAGIAIGAVAVNGLNAQGQPAAYAVVDISEITDPATFGQILPKALPASDAFGGKYIVRTNKITALDGTPPQRFVVIAFDSVEKAKAWDSSALQSEVNNLRRKSTKSRVFIADGELR